MINNYKKHKSYLFNDKWYVNSNNETIIDIWMGIENCASQCLHLIVMID